MKNSPLSQVGRIGPLLILIIALWVAPDAAFAQASPFQTGFTSAQAEILAWATPIGIILIMAVGFMAMVGRMTWGTAGLCILGVAIIFGAPQLMGWIRGMFGV